MAVAVVVALVVDLLSALVGNLSGMMAWAALDTAQGKAWVLDL
jgi:hypothetical protein